MTLYKELLNSTLPDDPDLEPLLLHYFPPPLPERYEQAIIQHRLRREIITTELTNQVINRGGMALVFGLNEETGQPNFHIVRAFLVANGIFDIPTLWHEIESLDNQINAPVHANLLTMTGQHLERATRWLLLQYRQMPLAITATIALFRPGVMQLTEHLFNLIGAAQTNLTAAIHELVTVNVPLSLATQVASLVYLLSALDIITVAKATSIPLETVAALYFQLGDRLQLHWLRDRISELPRDNRWTALSRSALREELYRTHREITTLILSTESTLESAQPKTMTPQILIDTWLTHQHLQLERYQQVLAELNRVAQPDLAMLSVALRQLRKVYE
jgi:glutamate dehydrogenase